MPALLADENVYSVLVDALRHDGWDVQTVSDCGLAGATDEAVLERARKDGKVLLTFDRDFADLRYVPRDVPGIIVLRFRQLPLDIIVARVISALRRLREDQLRRRLTVITPTAIRRRPLASAQSSDR